MSNGLYNGPQMRPLLQIPVTIEHLRGVCVCECMCVCVCVRECHTELETTTHTDVDIESKAVCERS